jgi:hypothetical protein
MSLPIFKSLVFLRGFFFDLMKHFTLGIFILITCSQAMAQVQLHQKVVDQGNVKFNPKSLIGYANVQAGIRFNDEHRGSISRLLFDSINQYILDSNAYSIVEFNIGSIATQNISFDILRPISKSGRFGITLKRTSNPGWVPRSFVRETKLGLALSIDLSKSLATNVYYDLNILDREQNGGVLDTTQYSLAADGANGLGLLSNVFLEEAYSRFSRQNFGNDWRYRIVETGKTAIQAGFQSKLSSTKFNYSDNNPDSAYYSQYNAAVGKIVLDSIEIASLSIQPHINVTRVDTHTQREIGVEIGLNQAWFVMRNNGRESHPMNQKIYSELNLKTGRLFLSSTSEFYLTGFNKGDYKQKANFNYSVLSIRDSNQIVGFDVFGLVRFQKSRQSMVMHHYLSTVKSSIQNSIPSLYTDYLVGGAFSFGKLQWQNQFLYQKIQDYVYFDQFGNVNQLTGDIELLAGTTGLEMKFEHLFMESSLTYQWNKRIKEYSLPEWVNSTVISTNWPLFDNRLHVNGGLKALFFSGYNAPGYIPFYNAGYSQGMHKFDDYFQLDAFVDLKIKTVTVGVGVMNTLYGIINDNPIIAPNYVRVPRYFSLKINWSFRN